MNFIKEQCENIRDINDIVSEDLQQSFRSKLRLSEKINRELELDMDNNKAYITINGINYPNITYAYGYSSFKQTEECFELFVKDFMSKLPEKCHVSFRQPITIEQNDNGYVLSTRIAVADFGKK